MTIVGCANVAGQVLPPMLSLMSRRLIIPNDEDLGMKYSRRLDYGRVVPIVVESPIS